MAGPALVAPTVVLTGAGVSTASGVPDFRSAGGLWDRYDPMSFSIDRFHRDPDAFWERRVALLAEMGYLDAKPNSAHALLAGAVRRGRVDRIVTQNVDGLHAKAGTPADRLIEVHGSGRLTICLDCGEREDVRATMARRPAGKAPRCPTCAGLQKPDVVLFGEPVHRFGEAAAAVARANTLVVAGSSLAVHPVATLCDLALAQGARLVVCNREATAYDDRAAAVARGPVEASLASLLPFDR